MSTAAALVDALFSRKGEKPQIPPPAANAGAPAQPSSGRPLTGAERSAILLLALGDRHGTEIWKLLDDEEIREISLAMSGLGTIDSEAVDKLLVDFVGQMSAAGALMGDSAATERLLSQFLPADRVSTIMEEVRGPAGRNMWEKLSNVPEKVLADYLKNEYPQTIAVVLSKLRPQQAARVLSVLPDPIALDVINRLLRMEAIQKDVLERVEQTLRTEFMTNLSQTTRRDPHEMMAEIFNNFDRQTEARFISALEGINREAAERVKTLMFTFDDLVKLDSGAAQTLVRNLDRSKIALALKGSSDQVRDFFKSNMSTRAAKMLDEEMEAMGPVRLREVDEAQAFIVNVAKDLAAKGEIVIAKGAAEEELVY